MKSTIFFVLSTLPSLLMASPINSCDLQSECMALTVSPLKGACGASCGFEVCLSIDSSKPGCAKGGGSISHACLPGAGCDSSAVYDFTVPGSEYPSDFYNTGLKCYPAKPNEYFQFILKDGTACSSSTADLGSVIGAPAGSIVTCGPTTGTGNSGTTGVALTVGKSCSGPGNVGKECIWTIKLPSDVTCGDCDNGPWSDYDTCSKSCGTGLQTRTRTACPGSRSVCTKPCNTQACDDTPVNPNEVPCDACAKLDDVCLKEYYNEIDSNPFLLSTDFGGCRNMEGIVNYLNNIDNFGCERSKNEGCNTIYCSSYIPEDIIAKLESDELYDLNKLSCDDAVFPGLNPSIPINPN